MDVRRVRTAKRRKEEKLAERNQIHLERVLGLTVLSNAGLACSPTTGTIAYPAGCTIVLYNARKNRQGHLTNPSRKAFTTLDFSEDGRYLVTGECGHQPHVRVWDVYDRSVVCEFPGHKYGVNCVSFAPNDKYVVSVGSQHDMIVNVWDWKGGGGGVKVASNKISAKVKAVSFAENGNYFVTAGNRHVKFWYLEYSRSRYQEPTPLTGRSAILGEQRNNYFCDVACGRGEMGDSTFAITKSGLLCEFNNRRLLDKWVELRTSGANCLSVGEDLIFIGCADGIVRCFSPHTLQFVTTLPRTHFLGVDVSKGLTINHMGSHPPGARYPDATAVTFDKSNFKVTVIYNDHSIYVWDVRDINKVGKSHSFLFHSACIWGLETYSSQQQQVLPQGSFVTCSSDDTIRIWNTSHNMSNNTVYRRNIYSDELLKMIYVDDDLEFIKDVEASGSKTDADQQKEQASTVYDQRNGVRCIRISPDGKHLASGDRAGNVRVHELQFMDEVCKIEAHDAEVLCLEYSDQVVGSSRQRAAKRTLLASASRDRLIHVFDATADYVFRHTLDDHSSSITAVRFVGGSSSVQMVSCGADKSIIFRDVALDDRGQVEMQRVNHVVGKTTLYDMEVDSERQQVLTACQDRNVRVYSVDSGKHCRTFKGSPGEDGTLIKVVLDRSGTYVATSCTDKSLAIYECATGEVAASMFGHSELVTGLRFTEDCKHLVSVSGDGCIFIWRLPISMTTNMLTKLSLKDDNGDLAVSAVKKATTTQHLDGGDYSFNVGQLPVWAKKQMGQDNERQNGDEHKSKAIPKGRWGERVAAEPQPQAFSAPAGDGGKPLAPPTSNGRKEENNSHSGRKVFSAADDYLNDEDYNSMSEIEFNRHGGSPFPTGALKVKASSRVRLNDADSSLGSLNVESTTEHDGDIDEYSDGLTTHDDGGESTEPEHPDRTLFFGHHQQRDPTPASEYPVNAIGGTGSGVKFKSEESDDEEDGDRESPPSGGAGTTEEQLDFLRSDYDSLSAAAGAAETEGEQQRLDTISNRYREGSSAIERNAATIARAQSFRDSEQNKRRQLLLKRIEETRRKLQDIGYRSMMRGSQSISDLTNATDTSHFMLKRNANETFQGYDSNRPTSTEPSDDPRRRWQQPSNDGLRRVCSLSDLTKQGAQRRVLPAPPISVSGKKLTPSKQSGHHLHLHHRPSRRSSKCDLNSEGGGGGPVPSYMRSTSSSTKKERSAVPLTPLGGARTLSTPIAPMSQSTTDLRQDSTSDEEEEDSMSSSGRRRWTTAERDSTKVTKVRVLGGCGSSSRPKMKTTTMIVTSAEKKSLDWTLVEERKATLQEASDELVQLYKRISLDHSLREDVRASFLQNLVGSAEAAQRILSPITTKKNTKITVNKGPSWC